MVRMEFLVVILWLVKATTGEEEARIAKGGCADVCGKVRIPYPFGIGPNCYSNPAFRITCNTSKPFLTSINMEVLRILPEYGIILVNSPITTSDDCPTRTRTIKNHPYMNLSGTPFSFSSAFNIFIGIGCNSVAKIFNVTTEGTEELIGGCMSKCNNTANTLERVDSTCNGVNCCQTNIPPSVTVFNMSFRSIGTGSADGGKGCKYGFLVYRDWFVNLRDSYVVGKMENVPIILDWRTDEMCLYDSGKHNLNDYTLSLDDYDQIWYLLYQMEDENGRSFRSRLSSRDCLCPNGNEGNPYLPNGCKLTEIELCDPWIQKYCHAQNGTSCLKIHRGFICGVPSNVRSLIGIGSGVVGLFTILATWWLRKISKKQKKAKLKKKFFKRNGGLLLQQQLCSIEQGYVEKTKLFTWEELEAATDHYNENRILGQGGQGTVYKGMLTNGDIVAVKKSKKVDEGKLDDFINEVVILSQINHRNVVKLHGCCLETDVPLLVYDFIPNGTLSQYIHDHQESEDFPLTWDVRLRIACEVAGALAYLHSAASLPIYHRDIKSSNILLDDKYSAKVADFGLSRSAAVDQTHLITRRVKGTFGYLDPEYLQSSRFTAKSDVYSFGVVLVELLTGLKAVLPITFVEARSLASYFMLSMKENRLFDILDAQVLKEGTEGEIIGVAYLVNRCLNLNGTKRPTMREVAMELETIKTTHAGSSHFQLHNEEVDDDYGITQLAGPFDCTATTSMTWLVGR